MKKQNIEINKQMHHRIKNNMQLMSSLINLQLRYSLDAHVMSTLKESKSRFQVLNILNKTIINHGITEHIQNTSDYIEKIITSNLNHYKIEKSKVNLQINVLGELKVEKAIALGLITNELFLFVFKHNTFKHKDEKIYFTLNQCPKNNSYFVQFKNKNAEGDWISLYSKTLSEQIISRLTNQLQSQVTLNPESMELSFSFK